jgi:hypothetical protein
MKLMDVLRKKWDSFVNFLGTSVPKESSLETDAKNMLGELDRHAEVVSFRMARADEARAKLEKELENYEALGKQAESYMRDGNEPYAKRTVVLQLESKKAVAAFQLEYQALQKEAESHVSNFITKRDEAKERVKTLPQLQQDARLIKADEEIVKLAGEFDLDSAKNQFDKTAQEIRIKKLQLQNRQLITSDPNAELDQKIRASLQDREVETAMKALAEKVQSTPENVIEAEYTQAEDPTLAAKKLLEAPRYDGLIQTREPAKVAITVRK